MQSATETENGSQIEASVTVNRAAGEVYQAWRSFEHHEAFMKHVESVEPKGERLSHWKVSGPGGISAEWDAEITADEKGKRIAWRTTEDADVAHSGEVRFEEVGNDATRVHLQIAYGEAHGLVEKAKKKVGEMSSKKQLQDDLERFKEIMEDLS